MAVSNTVSGEIAMARIIATLIRKSPGASTPLMMAKTIFAAAALLAAVAIDARADTLASACTKTYSPQTLENTQPLNLGQLKKQIYFYACSGAYDSEMNKVLADAKAYVEMRASQVTNPAIVLDIDETSLSNLPQELANDFGYIKKAPCENPPKGPCGWDDWMSEPYAKAIEGTLTLFEAAKAHKVAVFFITGRRLSKDKQEDDPLYKATVENLTKAGYAHWDGLTLRSKNDNMTVAGYKSGARAKIAEHYTIIVNVGDQQSDLAGGYAERAYKLPNPIYYIP
jgi:predicted secreted acid phosphatase